MNSARSFKRFSRGFTLIELLIVIAVIGILAVAVLSAINPIEQIRKGNDTAKKSDSAELLNAIERYFTTFQCYPWAYTTDCQTSYTRPTADVVNPNMTTGAAGGGTVASTLPELIAKNEMKPNFTTRKNLTNIYVSQDATNDLVHVCFIPDSKTFRSLAKYQRDGVTSCTAGTFTGTASAQCHICVPE